MRGRGKPYRLYVESTGYQAALVQQLKQGGVYAKSVQVGMTDKRARLAMTTDVIQSGKVLFPKHGAEQLIVQLTGFGVEKHDDLADAFSMLILQVLENLPSAPSQRPMSGGKTICGNLWAKKF